MYGFANRTATTPQPYPAEQLVLVSWKPTKPCATLTDRLQLTDAFCSSACATFVELMHHQAGVRTVVAGGRPELGPMQAVGGTRGAQAYTAVDIDDDIEVAEILNTTVGDVLPDRSAGGFITFADFNIKDAVRPGESLPLQFAYEAATCRIFYTLHTVYNYLNLWNYVVDAIWRNPSLCIDGSANGTTVLPTNSTGPAKNSKEITAADSKDMGNLILSGLSSGPVDPQSSSQPQKRDTPTPASIHQALSSHHLSNTISDGLINVDSCSACSNRRGYICAPVPTCINGRVERQKMCQRACQRGGTTCGGDTCYLDSGPGFCVSSRQILQSRSCSTPTRNTRTQTTRAVGDGNFNLPYSRNSPRIARPPP